MSYCARCGANVDGQRFCPRCGAQGAYEAPEASRTPDVIQVRSERPDNSLVWLMLAEPVLALVVWVGLDLSRVIVSGNTLGSAVGLATFVTALVDWALQQSRGVKIGLAWTLVPALYVLRRARATGQSYALPVAWLATFALFFGGGLIAQQVFGPFDISTHRVEQAIADGIHTGSASASCPGPDTRTLLRGDTFDCEVSTSELRVLERVTIHARGDVTWQPVLSSAEFLTPSPTSGVPTGAGLSEGEWTAACDEAYGDACSCAYDVLSSQNFDLAEDYERLRTDDPPLSDEARDAIRVCGGTVA